MGGAALSPPARIDRLIDAAAVMAFLSMVLLSAYGLNAIGWDYTTQGGPAITRLHPASYILALGVLLVLISEGNPLEGVVRIFGRDLRLALYLVGWLLMAYQAVIVQRLVIGIAIDTFLAPLMVVLLMDRVHPATRRSLFWLAHIAFIGNAALGLAEFLGGFRLTPIVIPGVKEAPEWRSSALFGHPLSNALMTGCYGIMLLLGAGARMAGWVRIGAIILVHFAMVAFGGRTSLGLLLLADVIVLLLAGGRFLAGGRVRLMHLAMLGIALPLLPLVAGGLMETGFFDKLAERFVSDSGSARARIIMFELFSHYSWPEILFGPPQDRLGHLTHLYGIEYGIESMWVAFVYAIGLIPSVLFWVALGILLLAVMARCDRRASVILLYFFTINSTFLGIAGKTHMLAFLIMTLLILLPRSAPAPAAHAAPFPALPGAQPC